MERGRCGLLEVVQILQSGVQSGVDLDVLLFSGSEPFCKTKCQGGGGSVRKIHDRFHGQIEYPAKYLKHDARTYLCRRARQLKALDVGAPQTDVKAKLKSNS